LRWVAPLWPPVGPASGSAPPKPEKALHPAVSTLLADAFLEASRSVQVVVTSHSPDLLEPLEHKELRAGSLIAVVAEDGITRLGEERACHLREVTRARDAVSPSVPETVG
jgi:hypothetical protein